MSHSESQESAFPSGAIKDPYLQQNKTKQIKQECAKRATRTKSNNPEQEFWKS